MFVSENKNHFCSNFYLACKSCSVMCDLFSSRNPAKANGHIFNVGNLHNEVTVRQLGEMMTKVKNSL